ncbi:hypothetical protein N865_18020 [Intrasporangium oryzae NRRL B-24470]|uniref:Hemagglutinin n=1 Tax=Intrasporangium oryzae NRRL B-24470 TaxID=1386089 RepID=W9G276_9MICO|nr:hypothetical protein [Intrasporangium oryzae]EWT00075.1 hypothetical protein N865_18020 [Intrasporangium oryzae NRRL B-24470]
MGNLPKRSSKRTLKAIVASVAVGAAMMFAGNVPAAYAVHDQAFQLDGDVAASTTTNIGGSVQNYDWSSLFGTSGEKLSLPTGFTASVFSKDFNTNANGTFNTSDATTYTTGSKDTLPISTGWQCTASNNVNSKIDVMNAYAAAYTDPDNGHQLLYFGIERNTNTGDANVAFWFLQDTVACNDNGTTASFTGDHKDGDLLVVSAFTNGGAVSTIDVYRWDRPNPSLPGSLNPTSVAHGVDCKSTSAGDDVCATTNGPTNGTNGTITTPWPTANAKDGVGHSLRTSEFYEGGLDLTAKGLGGHCFNTFTGDTRSSQSLTATLFDYSLGTLGECTSKTETTPSFTTQQIPKSGDPAITASDSAKITVTGISTFNATLKFFICGPNVPAGTGCTTGGDQVGSTQTITAQGTFSSSSATITEVGRYCWRAEFSGDSNAGVPSSKDDSTGECFIVTPRQPSLSTQAGTSPVDFGSPVTDTATLSNTADHQGSGGKGTDGSIDPTTGGGKAGGTITFTLLKDDCSTPATGTGTNPQSVNVSGDNTYGPVSFTPDAPGTYHWVASYSGDSPNTLKTDHNTACNDTNEDVVVRQIPTSISTAQKAYPNDSATISSTVAGDNLPSGGKVDFVLYDTLANCQAGGATGKLYTEPTITVGGQNSVTVGTSNTSVAVSTNTTVYWKVTYAPGDQAHTGRQSACAESTQFTFVNDSGPGTLYP